MREFRPSLPCNYNAVASSEYFGIGGNTQSESGFEPWKRLTITPAADLYFEGRLCVKHLQLLLWRFLWPWLDAQSMRGPIIPGSMRPHTNDLNSAAFTMGLKRAGTTPRKAGDRTSTDTATFAIHQSMVEGLASTGMDSTRAMSAPIVAAATVTGIVIGGD